MQRNFPVFIFISVLHLILFTASISAQTSRSSYRANFKECCAIGRQTANSSSANSCTDYSRLPDKSGGCKFAFTICCNQNKRNNECERGKKHAYAGLPCDDLKKDSYCDALTVNNI